MSESLTSALQTHFGFDAFRPGQREVIEHLMAGNSAAAVFPTGSGKSLCYQLPALLLPGVTLVVSPLIALMKDQIDALAARGIAAQRLDSTLSLDEYRDTMQRVRNGELRMLYVAPERFQNERFRESIQKIRVSLFAVDEAHCISEWGHNFRPDYLKLVEFARQCQSERVLALTATATPAVLDDIRAAFEIESQRAIRTGFYRKNLTVLTTPVSAARRDALLLERLRERPAGPTIVYVTLQKTAEAVANKLCAAGFQTQAYHAGLEAETRAAVQDWFLKTKSGIVVATIAFGMGVDKSDIRYVYHYNLPKSLENFAQEIGRSGRDGLPSICETLVCRADLVTLENFAYGDTPTLSSIRSLLRELFALGPQFDISYYELSGKHDIRILVVRTLLTYLELDGYFAGGTPFYSAYKFQPKRPSAEILANFAGERREFVADILRQVKKKTTWFYIDVDQAAMALRAPRERIIRALDYLGEQGWIDLRSEGTRNQYERLKSPTDQAALAADLHQRMVRREQREISRLQEVLALAETSACQINLLCQHFGETRSHACGHCTTCLQQPSTPTPEPASSRIDIDAAIVRQALDLRRQHAVLLADANTLARLLCGVSSPGITKAKLSSHALFGALAHVPFQDVRREFGEA